VKALQIARSDPASILRELVSETDNICLNAAEHAPLTAAIRTDSVVLSDSGRGTPRGASLRTQTRCFMSRHDA